MFMVLSISTGMNHFLKIFFVVCWGCIDKLLFFLDKQPKLTRENASGVDCFPENL